VQESANQQGENRQTSLPQLKNQGSIINRVSLVLSARFPRRGVSSGCIPSAMIWKL
jgi:hypothetical protein